MDWSTDGDGHSGYINVDWLKENDYSKESLSNYNSSIEPSVGVSAHCCSFVICTSYGCIH